MGPSPLVSSLERAFGSTVMSKKTRRARHRLQRRFVGAQEEIKRVQVRVATLTGLSGSSCSAWPSLPQATTTRYKLNTSDKCTAELGEY